MTQTIIKIPAAGAFDPTDITLTDNTSGALLIKEGSNEYMRINTTNGSELNQLKVPFTTGEFKLIQETSAGPYEFIKTDATSITLFPKAGGGGYSFNGMLINTAGAEIVTSNGQLNMGGSLPVSGAGTRAYISQSGNSWTELLAANTTSKIQRLDGLKMLEVDADSNATFTLDDSAGGIFKVQDDAGTPTEFLKIDSTTGARDVRLQTGHSNQYVLFNQTGNYSSFRNGNNNQIFLTANDQMDIYGKFCTHRQYSGGYFRSVNTGGTIQLFAVEENSNTTFRLNTATPGVFKVQDHGATNDFLKIDSDPTAALVEFNVPANQGAGMTVNLPADSGSNTGFQLLAAGGTYFKFGRQTTHFSAGTQLDVTVGVASFRLDGNEFKLQSSTPDIVMNLNSSSVDFKVTDAADATILEVKEDSSLTHTLDDGSGAVFKVVDDAASPKTYFSATENGNIQVGDFTGSVTLNADATGVSLRSNKIELRNGNANPLVTFSTDEVVYNGSGILIGDSYYGAPTDSTATETIANKEIHINQTFQYETTASAAGTVTVQFFTEKSFYPDGTTPTLRMVTLLNKNATHNVTYIFNVRSGYGTAYAMDSNATSLIGGGLTLTPGQAAIFRLVTFNKTATDSDAKHYFTTLGVG